MNFEQFFDDVISGHNDIIGYWFFTASKVLGWSLIILKNWGHSTYQYYVTFSESDPSFRFSQMKKSWKMNLFDRSNPCFRVSRYRWIRWWYQIFDIVNIGTFRFLKLKGPNTPKNELDLSISINEFSKTDQCLRGFLSVDFYDFGMVRTLELIKIHRENPF